jgi:uridylate kinase
METVVISIGGSVINSEETDIIFINKLLDIIKKLSKNYKLYLIIGGGKTARSYINKGREFGLEERTLDEIGIMITRVNAKLILSILGKTVAKIPETTNEAKKIDDSIVIMGGTTPGHSTDMVGAELAEKTKANRFIIATNVDGVYDKDPNRYKDAKKYNKISINDLIKKQGTDWDKAGKNDVIDGPALDIIKRSKIPTVVLNGKKLKQLENAIINKNFKGTTIIL